MRTVETKSVCIERESRELFVAGALKYSTPTCFGKMSKLIWAQSSMQVWSLTVYIFRKAKVYSLHLHPPPRTVNMKIGEFVLRSLSAIGRPQVSVDISGPTSSLLPERLQSSNGSRAPVALYIKLTDL